MKVLEFGNDQIGPATLFLHGFPGFRSKQNRDLAERAAKSGRRCFVPLYAGLGQADGEFSFLACRDQVTEFANQLLSRYASIDLVGHSWGGYLSLKLASQFGDRIGRLVLMSPLLDFFAPDLTEEAFRITAKENTSLNIGSASNLAEEFHAIGRQDSAKDFAQAISPTTEVSIFQARTDEITPIHHLEKLISHFKNPPFYEIVATDHSFLQNRDQALDRILNALTGSKKTRTVGSKKARTVGSKKARTVGSKKD